MARGGARARFFRSRGAAAGAALVAALVVFAVVGPALAGHDPYVSDFVRGATPDGMPVGPRGEFWLGTDRLFRDQLVRLAHGARLSLVIAIAATAVSSILGALVGIVSGYYEGTRGLRVPWVALASLVGAFFAIVRGSPRLALALALAAPLLVGAAALRPDARLASGPRLNADHALMRLVDIGLSFPFLLLVMALGAALDRTSVGTILLTLGLTSWLGTARVLRAKTLQVRGLDFVTAARALGQPTRRILALHVLPNVLGPLVVIATAQVAQMIVAESVLSYLGVGIAPPTPTWGRMLYESQDTATAAPWLLAAPALAIVLSVLGFNLVGDGLQDAFDPKE